MLRNRRLLAILFAWFIVLPARSADSADKRHWAFQPVVSPALPAVHDAKQVRTNIDRFILAALERKGLALAAEAERATLLRRLCFDLTGLPPTPEEVAVFVNDQSSDPYDKLVERYLASPRYGERWGKHWLRAAG